MEGLEDNIHSGRQSSISAWYQEAMGEVFEVAGCPALTSDLAAVTPRSQDDIRPLSEWYAKAINDTYEVGCGYPM